MIPPLNLVPPPRADTVRPAQPSTTFDEVMRSAGRGTNTDTGPSAAGASVGWVETPPDRHGEHSAAAAAVVSPPAPQHEAVDGHAALGAESAGVAAEQVVLAPVRTEIVFEANVPGSMVTGTLAGSASPAGAAAADAAPSSVVTGLPRVGSDASPAAEVPEPAATPPALLESPAGTQSEVTGTVAGPSGSPVVAAPTAASQKPSGAVRLSQPVESAAAVAHATESPNGETADVGHSDAPSHPEPAAPAAPAPAPTASPADPDATPTQGTAPTPTTGRVDLQGSAPASAGAGTTSVERVVALVEQLKHAPPPRTVTVDLEGLGGMRMVVSLRGESVVIAPVGGQSLDAGFTSDLSRGFAEAGLRFAAEGQAGDGTDERPRQRRGGHPAPFDQHHDGPRDAGRPRRREGIRL